MEKKKIIKKKKKETDYQRRYKNEWIAPQNIYTVLWNPANISFFYIQKLSFHYSPFCTRIKQKFYGEQFFQDHKTFHQLPNWLSPDNVNDFFLRGGFFITEGDFDTRSNIKRGHFCQIVSRHLLSGCVKSGIVGD